MGLAIEHVAAQGIVINIGTLSPDELVTFRADLTDAQATRALGRKCADVAAETAPAPTSVQPGPQSPATGALGRVVP